MFALLFSRYVWISRKTKISIKTRPNLKKTNWSMMIMHIIFYLMGNDLQKLIYDLLVIGIEMILNLIFLWWGFPLCENYTPLMRFSSAWMHPVFPLIFFRNKMWNDLKSHFWFCELHLCAFLSHCCILKNIVLIKLEIDSFKKHFHNFFWSTLILFLFLFFVSFLYIAWGQARF